MCAIKTNFQTLRTFQYGAYSDKMSEFRKIKTSPAAPGYYSLRATSLFIRKYKLYEPLTQQRQIITLYEFVHSNSKPAVNRQPGFRREDS